MGANPLLSTIGGVLNGIAPGAGLLFNFATQNPVNQAYASTQAQAALSPIGNNFNNPPTASNPTGYSSTNSPTPFGPTNNLTYGLTNPVANTGGSTGGSTGGGSNGLDPHINPSTGVWDDNYYQTTQAAKDAAQAAYNAENSRLNTQFDQSAANLNSQLPYLQQQRDSALSSLDTANQQATDQANSARLSAQNSTNDQINQAGDVAHQTQNQNRNILRALGIGGGTYAAELLSKPINTYDQQRGQLMTSLQQRGQQLDDYLNTVTQQHAQAVSDLQNNYANLVGKIQSDLRFNDRQRNDALAAANAALQTNLANIQSSAQQYALKVQQMKMQLAQQAGVVTNYTNPTADTGAITAQTLSNTGAGNQFSTGNLQALVPANQKKTDSNNPFQQYVNNGGLTLSGWGQ